MELNERKKLILRAVVDSYIERFEPVGSKYLTEHLNIDLSPATIRSVMSELEQMGLLESPHTSAGRVPSSLGYRIYVDNLMESYRLTSSEINEIESTLSEKISHLDKLIEQAGKIMSSLTSLMSFSMKPKIVAVTILKFENIYFDSNNFILIIITSLNIIKTTSVHTEIEIDADTLSLLTFILNDNLIGIDIEQIPLLLIIKMEDMMGKYKSLVTPVLKVILEMVTDVSSSDIFFDGATNLLRYPEYHDIEKLKDAFDLMEKKDAILNILSDAKPDKINIYIGEENKITTKGDTSLVFKTFSTGNRIMGAIGVIGPKRMEYSKVIANLEYFSENIKNLLNKEFFNPDGESDKQ